MILYSSPSSPYVHYDRVKVTLACELAMVLLYSDFFVSEGPSTLVPPIQWLPVNPTLVIRQSRGSKSCDVASPRK